MANTTNVVIAGAKDVWTTMGPGHSETVYQKALEVYLRDAGVRCASEQVIPIMYRGVAVGSCRADIVTADLVIELKACASINDSMEQQTRKYMTALPRSHGLLVNFPQRRDATGPDFQSYTA